MRKIHRARVERGNLVVVGIGADKGLRRVRAVDGADVLEGSGVLSDGVSSVMMALQSGGGVDSGIRVAFTELLV